MKFSNVGAALLALIIGSEASPLIHPQIVHEKRATSSYTRYVKRGRVGPDSILPIRIGLSQTGLEHGYDHVMDVSDPNSANYGKHWSAEQVHDFFAPADDAVAAVKEWLIASGVDAEAIVHSDNKGWLALDIPTSHAERLFDTEYYEHEHIHDGTLRLGCDQYHLPHHLQGFIDYVTPGVKLSAPMKRSVVKRSKSFNKKLPVHQVFDNHFFPWTPPAAAAKLPLDLQDCGRNITPKCIKALYNIPDAFRKDSVNSLGLYEGGDFYAQEDLNLFFAQYAPQVPQGTHPIPQFIDGAQAPVAPDDPTNTGESDIDMDMAYSLIYPQTVTLYQTDDSNYSTEELTGQLDGFLNTFLDALDGSYCTYTSNGITGDSPGIDPVYPDPQPGGYKGKLQCGVYKPTRVISGSYGEAEADLPNNYQQRQCNEFMKLALQGHTILFSSSDYGVASFPGDGSANGCLGPAATVYSPDYPVNCPYITAVGGTRLYAGQTVLDPESALQANLGPGAELFASGGGFSNYFPTPGYQKSAVSSYFQAHDPGHKYYTYNGNNIGANGGIYNRGGRGYPDVSANGAQFRAYTDGVDYHYYGTSLSAPLFASIVTLINEERTAIGKGPVGFINPTLYSFPFVLNDIKNGSNPGCGSSGFSAVSGWDPVTGLGTPSYPKLLALFLGLP